MIPLPYRSYGIVREADMNTLEHIHIPEQFQYYAPVFVILKILSRKWTLPILLTVREPILYSRLHKRLQITHTVLSNSLEELTGLLLVKRTVITATNPPSVEYTLTEYGERLLAECLNFMSLSDYCSEIAAAQQQEIIREPVPYNI